MADEIELKFIEIDKEATIKKILALGAVKEYETQLASRHFESKEQGFSGSDSSKKFLRVRKLKDTVLITFKGPAQSKDIHIREEIEIEADNFETSVELFSRLGLEPAPLFSKIRSHFSLGADVHFEIDEVRGIPVYLEVETKTEEQLIEICGKLGLDPKDGHAKTIVEIYPEKFEKR